jgi:hypothetical protein
MGILLSMLWALGTFIMWEVINGKCVWVSPNSFEKILMGQKVDGEKLVHNIDEFNGWCFL